MKTSVSVIIKAPVGFVWNYILDAKNFNSWMGDFSKATLITGREGEVGSQTKVEFNQPDQRHTKPENKNISLQKIKKIQPNECAEFLIKSSWFKCRVFYKFYSIEKNLTRLTVVADYQWLNIFDSFLGFLLKDKIQAEQAKSYMKAKILIENSFR